MGSAVKVLAMAIAARPRGTARVSSATGRSGAEAIASSTVRN